MSTPPVIVVIGITGDLSKRKLLPALYHLFASGSIDPLTTIIGTSRKPLDIDALLSETKSHIVEKDTSCQQQHLQILKNALVSVQFDPSDEENYDALRQTLDGYDTTQRRNRLYYMAIPSSAFSETIQNFGRHNLNDERTRLLVEKPFGQDVTSAKQLVEVSQKYFSESQLYRIDHYLAKETAQNILTFRTQNPIFSSLWNHHHIKKIHVTAAESIGVENRAAFYEETGALRDIIQGHLLQLLALSAMRLPTDNSDEALHTSKERFLDSIEPADPAAAERGQYRDYRSDVKNQTSQTETYTKLSLRSRDENWKTTEFILETGKRMAEKSTQVVVEFSEEGAASPNHLIFSLQPNEAVALDLLVKVPGFDKKMQQTQLDYTYEDTFDDNLISPDAYERVIIDAIRGDQSLFASSKEVIASWKIVQPVLDAWARSDESPTLYE